MESKFQIEREKMEKDFSNVYCDMSPVFLKALADNQVINEEEISTAKIAEIYGPLKQKVNQSIKKQEDCLAEVEVNSLFYCCVASSTWFAYASNSWCFRFGIGSSAQKKPVVRVLLNVNEY